MSLNSNVTVKALKKSIEKKENAVFSPVSLYFVLAMLWHAATAGWRKKLEGFGNFTVEAVKEIWAMPAKFWNGCWYNQEKAKPSAEYTSLLADAFRAEAVACPANDLGTLVQMINTAAERGTDGMFREVIKPNQLSNWEVVLMNTTLVLAKWASKFDPKNTQDGTFNGPNGGIKVKFMHKTEALPYVETHEYQSVSLPMAEDGRFVQVVLPRAGVSLEQLVDRIDELTSLNHREQRVALKLPKLNIQGKTDAGTLLGLDSVDLEKFGLDDSLLCLYQLAKLEADEEGVKAAAVTIAIVRTRGAGPRIPVMEVDRPFILIIKEKVGFSFIAVVFDPTK